MQAFTGVHMMKKSRLAVIFAALVVTGVAHTAEPNSTGVLATEMGGTTSQQAQSIPSYKMWTQEDIRQSQSWGMSKTEWLEYKDLMSNSASAAYYRDKPELTPLMVMGINAKTATERTRYARLSVEMEQERLRKEVLFDEAVNAHIKSMIPNHPVWMTDLERRSWAKQNAAAGINSNAASKTGGSSVASFTDTRTVAYVDAKNCDTKCIRFISGLAAKSSKINRLDLFVMGADSDKQLLSFASQVGVSTALLSAAKATVNYEQGYYSRIKPSPGLPVAYRVQLDDTIEIKP